jgi:hypothetical protein
MINLLLALTIAAPLESSQNSENVAGLIFKTTPYVQESPMNVGTMQQERVTHKTQLRQAGVQYVDNCGKDARAIGSPRTVNDPGTETIFSGPVTPYLVGKRSEAGSWFVSQKTPPAPGLRVIVRNATATSVIDQMPYTDREYDKGERSERFVAALETGHHGKFLAMQMGVNQFIYTIKRGDQVIESGKFSATIDLRVSDISVTETSHELRKEDLYCVDKREDRGKEHDRMRFPGAFKQKH